ncbi:MAG: hypothetical protein M1827_002072 [Pycnora praestabilis]|nr:MAG: hypothetical protein M1827_002072 [Pycnora praestabilis]
MSTLQPDDSVTTRSKVSAQFSIHEDQSAFLSPAIKKHGLDDNTSNTSATGFSSGPLTTSKLSNQLPSTGSCAAYSCYKKPKLERPFSTTDVDMEPNPMDQLLAKLSEQQVLIEKQKNALASNEIGGGLTVTDRDTSSNGSVPMTPATETFDTAPATNPAISGNTQMNAADILRIKQELLEAKEKIARMDQELSQTRITKHTLDEAFGPPSEADFRLKEDITEQTISNLQNALKASTRPALTRHETWATLDDARSDSSGNLSATGVNRANAIWGIPTKPNLQFGSGIPLNQQPAHSNGWTQDSTRPWLNRAMGQGMPQQSMSLLQQQQQQRPSLGPLATTFGNDSRFLNDLSQGHSSQCLRPNNQQTYRFAAPIGQRNNGYGSYATSVSSAEGVSPPPTPYSPMAMFPGPMAYQPRPIGTPLSPTAAEFTTGPMPANPWNAQALTSSGPTYVSPMEPLNYRRLLDRSVTCNWKYIVDKIVCNNDQQASIFLQQKLKIGTLEQKYEIVEAIVAQAYPLMINRFGNFLVQRCFEHGTPEQVVSIANAIRGNTLNLSMDAFGCHVVQKAFDAVPEDYKAIMVHELLRRIPETVIHRYACHVWQKLFELRWSDSPPQIMKYVNEALRGMWHEVALGETGSLVVQNIFENCLEEDKRPCINEVLGSIDIVAHGQFGNWCIQHICEHGLPADRSRAIDYVLRYANEYSVDQFASKVVEKCLKIGGPEFLERYLDRVCEGRPDRPRIPLIDIASDQYGNYLIQYILTHANPQHRETVATHIRFVLKLN